MQLSDRIIIKIESHAFDAVNSFLKPQEVIAYFNACSMYITTANDSHNTMESIAQVVRRRTRHQKVLGSSHWAEFQTVYETLK